MAVYYDREILNGLKEIPVSGCPGSIVVTGEKAQAVFTGETSGDVFMAAAEYGNGRVFVVAHDCYYSWLDGETTDNLQKDFINNVKRWLARTDDIYDLTTVSMDDVNEDTDFGAYQIVKWHHNADVNQKTQNNLLNYLEDGGSLFCAATPWGYLQVNSTQKLEDLTMHVFLRDFIGLVFTDRCLSLPETIPISNNQAKYANFHLALAKVTSNPSKVNKYCATIECGVDVLKQQGTLNTDLIQKVQTALVSQCEEKNLNIYPTEDKPVKNRTEKNLANLYCTCLIGTQCDKAPNIEEFPGDFKELPPLDSNITLDLETQFVERLSTGYYLPAGVCMNVEVLEGDFSGWKLRIGAHTDNISQCDEYSRWPVVTVVSDLTKNMEICSPFGGLVYFDSPSAGRISVVISNVVASPYYDLTKPETAFNWNLSGSKAPGLWAELAGEFIIFTCPSDAIRHLYDPKPVIKFWDEVVRTHYECRGNNPREYARQRVVSDKQASAGYMHSGYPIVTHLDVCYETCDECIFNIEKLREKGNWGLFHEIGHNMQRDEWTFEGCGEVTVNIFSMHAMEFIIGKRVIEQPWLLDQKKLFKKYFSKVPTYDDWQNCCQMALMTFAQLIKYFGWDPMHKFLSDYEEDIKNSNNLPSSNQEKIDQWVLRYSRLVNYNITAQFQMWGLPVSDSVQEVLQDLPSWCSSEDRDPEKFFS